MRIFVYGSIAYDRIMNFPGRFKDHILPEKIHQLNVSFLVQEFKESFGGAGGNIAYNLSLLEEEPLLYGSAGRDFISYAEHFENLDLRGVKVYQNDLTASAYIITDKDDNQITGFFPGAMRYHARKPDFKSGDLLIIAPGNSLEMLDLAELASAKNIPFIFDPGQQIIQFTKSQLQQALKKASFYIVNDYERSLTEKITGYRRELLLKNAGVFITTLGAKGSQIEIQTSSQIKKFKILPAKVAKIVDPTGAGDGYRAGLIKGLSIFGKHSAIKDYQNLPWQKIGQMASLAAVYAVEHYGTQNHHYTYQQFKKRYKLNFKETL